MKYQFQFAGANVSRRNGPQKSRLRMAILGAGLIVAALAYANYLFNIFHLPFHRTTAIVASAKPVAATVAVAAPVKNETKGTEQATTALKDATGASISAVESTVTKTLDTAPVTTATPMTPVVTATITPSTTVSAVPASSSVVKPQVVSITTSPSVQIGQPTTGRPAPVLKYTPQERLLRAGQMALQTTLDQATKYPDAYGFKAEDVFAQATLGDPMPIYTIEETDRAKYRRGEAVKPILKEAKQWAFPVTINNRICCMVLVTYSGHDYVPGKGSKMLGTAWSKIQDKWPTEDGYHPCLVMNPEVPGYYFTVPELPEQNMTDIVRLFDFHPALSPAEVILASWR